MNDFYAMVVIEFDEAVDAISRAMFAERLAEYSFVPLAEGAWSVEFEARATLGCEQMLRGFIEQARSFARIDAGQIKAVAHFGPDAPQTL
jgi:hypothetical protein